MKVAADATIGRRRRRSRGFGILEVLISAAMLIAGITGIIQAQASITASMARERRLMTATHVAEQTIERLLVLFPADGELAHGPHTGTFFDDEGLPAATGRFRSRWTVTVGDPVPGTRRIVVEVEWADGATRVVTFSTIRT